MPDEPQQQEKSKGWLASLTSRIVALTALLGALATLLLNAEKLLDRFFREEPPDAPVAAPASHALDCIQVEPKYLPVIPYALKHNFDSSESLYWLKLRIENNCGKRYSLRVICDPVGADVGVTCDDYPSFDVLPGDPEEHDPVDYQIDPDLKFEAEVAQAVTLKLKIIVRENLREDPVYDDTLRVTVLPQSTYFWDLEDISKEAVLASLAIWTVRPRAQVAALADRLEAGYSTTDSWMMRAYDAVFKELALKVVPDDRQIPPKPGRDRVKLNTPEEVLGAGRAHPVEAALLFGALGYKIIKERSARIVLISAPPADPGTPNLVFVAWESGGRLEAFEMPTTMSEENERSPPPELEAAKRRATEHLGLLLQTIHRALDLEESTGVFIRPEIEGVVALDLGLTIAKHSLDAGLPSWTPAPTQRESPGRPPTI